MPKKETLSEEISDILRDSPTPTDGLDYQGLCDELGAYLAQELIAKGWIVDG